jgi:uncharacterized protein (DUF58 family)
VKVQAVEAALLGALGFVLLLYFNPGHPALGTLAALIFGTWVVARIAPHLFLRQVSLECEQPASAAQDDTVGFSFRARSRAARFFTLEDSNPAAFPDERKPGFYVQRLGKGEELGLRYERTLYKRGVYTIGPTVVRCGFPLGVVEIVREIANTTRKLHVLPRVYPLRRLPLAGLYLGQPNSLLVARGGGDQTFLGVREYTRGDSPRHIHWPSTAKQGKPIVKDFESERAGRLTLLLDLHPAAHAGEGRDATFEYLATIAASVAAFALEHRQEVQLLGWRGEPYHRGPVSGRAALGMLLHALAELEPAGGEHAIGFGETVARLGTRLPPGGTVVCVFSDINPPEIWNALIALESRNLEVCAVILRAATFGRKAPVSQYAPPSTIPAIYVSRGGDLSVQFGAS